MLRRIKRVVRGLGASHFWQDAWALVARASRVCSEPETHGRDTRATRPGFLELTAGGLRREDVSYEPKPNQPHFTSRIYQKLRQNCRGFGPGGSGHSTRSRGGEQHHPGRPDWLRWPRRWRRRQRAVGQKWSDQ